MSYVNCKAMLNVLSSHILAVGEFNFSVSEIEIEVFKVAVVIVKVLNC